MRNPALAPYAKRLAMLSGPLLALLGATSGLAQRPTAEDIERQLATPRPIEAVDSVWIEELTWMEVRDAIKAGKTTAIVASGGIEQNGPYVVTGKHNVLIEGTCEAIARRLGDALCAPTLRLVPEGGIDPPSGHMHYPGTFSVRDETYEAILEDMAGSLRAHGFQHIAFLGDSGGNQAGMKKVAALLTERWKDTESPTAVHFIAEYYDHPGLLAYLENDLGIKQPENDGLHDDYAINSMLMVVDPTSVRYEQRKKAGKATINGVALDPIEETLAIGRRLTQRRVDLAVASIEKARSSTR